MKKSVIVSAVVIAHVAVGSAFLIQGCGTTRAPVNVPAESPMPPSILEESVDAEKVVAQPVTDTPVAPVAPEAKTWPVSETTTYVVGKGDTLSHIAHRFDLTIAEIMTLNKIADPDTVRIGQKLVLPGKLDVSKPAKPTAASASKPSRKPLPSGSNAYVVQPGDCLSVIAARADISTDALQKANDLRGDKIYVGQTLAIPGGKPVAKPASNPAPKPKKNPVSTADTAFPAVAPERDLAPEMEEGPVEFDVPDLSAADAVKPEPKPASAPRGSATMYTVQSGDDILTVASEHNVRIQDLRTVNRLTSDKLVPGQKLVIPTED